MSINQPAYLPWLGYFHRIAVSDLHIVLDDVQFEKNSFTNRNKIRTRDGWSWLTVPVKTSGRFGNLPIHRLEPVQESGWAAKHWKAIQLNYRRAEHFAAHQPFLADTYTRNWPCLSGLMKAMNECLLARFDIATPLRFSSEIKVEGRKDELVLNLCKAVGATIYLSGPLGRNYLREELFKDAGIEVRYHDYRHPVYRQVYPGFEPGMCALDLLLNCGPHSREILMSDAMQVAR